MNPEVLYFLKANVALSVFYIFYWIFLRKETFYEWNRYYFLLVVPVSFLFPLIDLSRFFSTEQVLIIRQITPLLPIHVSGKEAGLTIQDSILFASFIGTGVLLIRLGIQLISLWKIRKDSTPGGFFYHYRIRNLHSITNPFSFFGTIYVNPELHSSEEMETILNHEKIHAQQKHSFDILLLELVRAFCWYNPFVWLIRQAIKQNIEFYTDKQVLEAGYDRRHYQHELLKVSQIPSFLSIANNFNFNHLKQRIMMMNKQPSGKMRLIKFALILPVFAGMALLSNAKEPLMEKISGQKQAEKENKDKNTFSTFKITVNEKIHDFGTIKESDGKVSTVFTITNEYEFPLVIEKATASCGCTTPEWTKEPILPGKQGYIKATYDPTNRVHAFDKTITVVGNVKMSSESSMFFSEVFHVKGMVVDK